MHAIKHLIGLEWNNGTVLYAHDPRFWRGRENAGIFSLSIYLVIPKRGGTSISWYTYDLKVCQMYFCYSVIFVTLTKDKDGFLESRCFEMRLLSHELPCGSFASKVFLSLKVYPTTRINPCQLHNLSCCVLFHCFEVFQKTQIEGRTSFMTIKFRRLTSSRVSISLSLINGNSPNLSNGSFWLSELFIKLYFTHKKESNHKQIYLLFYLGWWHTFWALCNPVCKA